MEIILTINKTTMTIKIIKTMRKKNKKKKKTIKVKIIITTARQVLLQGIIKSNHKIEWSLCDNLLLKFFLISKAMS